MADYNAPVRDMQFVLNELIPLSDITALPGYEEADEDLAVAILDEAAKFADGVLAPLNWTGDQEGCALNGDTVKTPKGFKEAYHQYAKAGWIGLGCDPEFGGQGLPSVVATAVNEMWHGANMSHGSKPRGLGWRAKLRRAAAWPARAGKSTHDCS